MISSIFLSVIPASPGAAGRNLDKSRPVPPDMAPPSAPTRADVVVIGGGCMGASTAFHLARKGLDVILVERRHLASGATGHSGAIVRQHYETRIGIRLARESLRFFQRFEAETGHPCDFRQTGFLSGARPRDARAFDALLALLHSEGVRVERLSPREAMDEEPQLVSSDLAAVVHDPDAGYADPIATAVGFGAAARDHGATILENSTVKGFATRRGRVTGVRLRSARTIASDRVVLTGGNWTPRLARTVGVRLPIRFVRGEVAILRRPSNFGAPPKIHFDFYGNTYSRPEGDKDVLVGYRDTPVHRTSTEPELRDDSVPTSTVHDLRGRLAARFPAMARAQPRGGWAGLYDVTPDAYPILDAVGPEGLYVAVGFSGHGFKLAPAVGRLLAEFVSAGRRPEALAPLRASRFREHALIQPEAPFPARRGSRLP